MKRFFSILFSLFIFFSSAQDWTTPDFKNKDQETSILNKKRRNILLISEATLYSVALVGLNELWYADYPKSRFHFINDNEEWLQMDKIGHLTTSYHLGVVGIRAYKWTGMKRKKAIWYGGLTGSLFLSVIEVLDGKSAEWGASPGDFIANTTGSLLAISQELAWNEQRITLKYSYSPSEWAKLNPDQLGRTHLERAIKDYNGQTYWLSFNLKSLLDIQSSDFPSWLNLAIGYSGDNMITPYPDNNDQRKRQYLLSLDVDLSRVKTNSKICNSILHTFSFLKFPMPALEFSNGSLEGHLFYY